MGGFVKVCASADIPLGTMKAFEVNYNRFVVVHTAEGFFAVADECSHDSEPISSGRLRGHELMCTRHGARFDVRTGAVTAPPALVPIDTYNVKVDGPDLFVYLD